jgi:hypothetical protein
MRKHRSTLVAGLLLVAVVFGFVCLRNSHDPTFRGQPESHWITNIVYNGPEDQTERWRSYGLEGARVLTRYLDRDYGWRQTYRKAYRRHAGKLPQVIVRQFPTPIDNRSTRMCVLSLLSSMCVRDTNTARFAESTIARAMEDENPALRQIAVGAYEGRILRAQISPALKQARINQFLRLAEDDNHWVRGNAAIALSYFPEEAKAITPVLKKILPEPHPHLQLTIAKSLVRVDREAAAQAGVAAIAAEHMQEPEKRFQDWSLQRWNGWEISRQAAEVLGELHAAPAVSIPVLIEGLGSTNREIAIASFRSLTKFKDETEQTLPALRKAAERSDIPDWIKSELKQIDPSKTRP